jgi:hypothetical protein
MTRILLTGALTVAVSLATAPAADAKGVITAISVCGPSGCATASAPRATMLRFGVDMLGGNSETVGPPPLGPYYRLAFRPRHELPDADTFFVPGADLICTDRGCIPAQTRLAPALDAAAAQVVAFRPVIRSVTIDGTVRSDPGAYAGLYAGSPAAAPPSRVWESRGYSIQFAFSRTAPWSLAWMSGMAYYPRYRVVARAGTWLHVSAALDRRIRTGSADARTASGGGDRWPIAAAAAVAIAAAAGAGRRLRRPGAA